MAQQVAPKENITVIKTAEGEEIKLSSKIVRDYLVNGDNGQITDQEIKLYIGLCSANKLNPFNKECYLIKYGSQPAQMVVSKDVFQKRANRNPNYLGKKAGIIVIDADCNITYRSGTFYMKEVEQLVGGWCEVYIKGRDVPERIEVSFDEYAGRKKDGSLNNQWATKPAIMIRKVAVSTALREAFTEDLSNMYSPEEFGQSEEELMRNEHPKDYIDNEGQKPKAIRSSSSVKANPFKQALKEKELEPVQSVQSDQQDEIFFPGL